MNSSSRSPLKARPLRNPGQSLDQEIDALIADKFTSYYFFPVVLWLLAGTEWVATLVNMPRQPLLYASAAAIFSLVSGVRLWQLRTRLRAVKLGRDGERAVGQFLESLRKHGARIFHDVPGEGFNLDHVVVSQHGIFVIETKTLSKPSPRSEITLRGSEILVEGRAMDRNPIDQVRAQVTWLKRLLEESTGKSLPIRGAVVFPGWFVRPPANDEKLDVWVLEPKCLPAFIQREPVRMEPSNVALAAFHLSRYVRTS